MKKLLLPLVLATLSSPLFAETNPAAHDGGAVASVGQMLVANNGTRLGSVYRVGEDGSIKVIVDGKMVTIPAATLSIVDGTLTTNLSKNDVRKLK